MGYGTRYTISKNSYPDFHPGVCADIIIDGKKIGVIGRVHPNISKEEIYVFELNLDALYGRTSSLKYKAAYKYPSIEKDMAFVVDKDIPVTDLIKTIKNASNRTLQDIKVFDVYSGKNIADDKKSIAFNLVFNGLDHTLTDNEVMDVFDKIIKQVENKYHAVLRDK